MATRPVVPRATGEGSIGTAAKHWGAGHFDTLPNWQEYLAESTGYGIVSGCEPSISGLTVTVGAGIVHLANGTRKEISTSNITLDAADSTNPRIDLVYIDSTGAGAKVTGTSAASPVVPSVPSGGISVAQVSVAANATAGTITDMRGMLPRFYNTGIVSVKDFGAVGDGVTDDTAAIQNCIDNNKGKIISFPSGTYIISETIYTYRGDTDRSLLKLDNATIKASNNFPVDDFAVVIGDANTGNYASYDYAYTMTGLVGGVIDCNRRAYGALKYTEGSLGKLMDFSVKNGTQVGVQISEENARYSTDIYISRLKIDSGTNTEGSIGLLVYGWDNNIEYVRTTGFPIGIQIKGPGNFLRECHPLYWSAVYTEEIGFDIYSPNTYATDCYTDAFGTAIRINTIENVIIRGFFALYTDRRSKYQCTFVENTAEGIGFLVEDAQVQFPDSASYTNVGYVGNDGLVNRDDGNIGGFFNCKFMNVTSRLDKAITYPYGCGDSSMKIGDTVDLNNVAAPGIYNLENLTAANNDSKHRPSVTYSDGILKVESKSRLHGGAWDKVIQTIYFLTGGNMVAYQRIYFGYYPTIDASRYMYWSNWKQM